MKTGVVLVVHGEYGRPLQRAAEQLVGPLPVAVMEVPLGVDRDRIREGIERLVGEQEQGQGVLLLVDVCGSTPANLCLQVSARRAGCETLTGLNLAMLMKLSTCDRTRPAAVLAEELRRSAQRSIQSGADLLHKGEPGGY